MRRVVIAAALGGAALAGAATGQPEPPQTFSFTSTWTGEAEPVRLWVEQGPQQFTMTRSGTSWTGTAPGAGIVLSRRASLLAEFADGRIALPIRFVPAKPQMRFSVQNPALLACIPPNVTRLESPGPSYSAQADAYFKARRLAQEGDCGPTMQRRVVKAWFDRSYILQKENDHIALDQEALAALQAYPQHTNYATLMGNQATGRQAHIDYAYQQSLYFSKDFAAAAEVNAAIAERIREDETFAAGALEQGLTLGRLQSDGALLAARRDSMSSPQE